MEVAKFFVKETDNKDTFKTVFYDAPYISLQKTNLWSIVVDFFRELKLYIFRKNKVSREDMLPVLRSNAVQIYEEINQVRMQNNIPRLQYEQFFDFEDVKIPNYIN